MFSLVFLTVISSIQLLNVFGQNATLTLKVLEYNMYMQSRWQYAKDKQNWREEIIFDEISTLDATEHFDFISFHELFDEDRNDYYNGEFCSIGFCYNTDITTDSTVNENAIQFNLPLISEPWVYPTGTKIFSKHPIDFANSNLHLIYDECKNEDCIANKGAVYAKTVKDGITIHIFATHLQSGNSNSKQAIKAAQLQELRDWMDTFSISGDDITLVVGDFNIDPVRDPSQYSNLLSTLNVVDLDINSNSLPDTTLTDMDIRYTYKTPATSGNWLDHIFVEPNNHILSTDIDDSYLEAIRIYYAPTYDIKKVKDKWTVPFTNIKLPVYGGDITISDLSNHHGLIGHVTYTI